MYHLTEAYLLAGFICLLAAYLGALLFSTIVVAPLIVRTLDGPEGSRLLRAYWPKIHAFAVIGGTALTLIMAGSWSFSALPAVYAMAVIAAAGLMTMCSIGRSVTFLTQTHRT